MVAFQLYGDADFYGNRAINVTLENARFEIRASDPEITAADAGRFWQTESGEVRFSPDGEEVLKLYSSSEFVAVHQGYRDLTANANYPAAVRGDMYAFPPSLGGGLLGGADGLQVSGNDVIVCNAESSDAGGYGTAGGNWTVLRDWRSIKSYVDAANARSYFVTVAGETSGTFDTGTGALLMDVRAFEGPPYAKVNIGSTNQSGVVTWQSDVPFYGIIVATPINLVPVE